MDAHCTFDRYILKECANNNHLKSIETDHTTVQYIKKTLELRYGLKNGFGYIIYCRTNLSSDYNCSEIKVSK